MLGFVRWLVMDTVNKQVQHKGRLLSWDPSLRIAEDKSRDHSFSLKVWEV